MRCEFALITICVALGSIATGAARAADVVISQVYGGGGNAGAG